MSRSQLQLAWLLTRRDSTVVVARATGYLVNWVREVSRRDHACGPDAVE